MSHIEDCFKEHMATLKIYKDENENEITVLNWKKPSTSTYYIRYILDRGSLIVTGDMGEAIYQWSERITLKFLNGCYFGYFAGKCQASEVGRDFKEWNSDLARKRAKEYIEEYDDLSWDKFVEAGGDAEFYYQEDWHKWLEVNGDDLLGQDHWEWSYSCGLKTHHRCEYHKIGLEMAFKQLEEKSAENIVDKTVK